MSGVVANKKSIYRGSGRGSGYDALVSALARARAEAVEALALQEGMTVVDVACGTGLSFAALERAVGPSGRLLAVDASPSMLERARMRVAEGGWDNVELLEAAVEHVDLETAADAALFSFTHDVLASERSVAAIVSQLRPAASVVSVGVRLPAKMHPLNPLVKLVVRPFVSRPKGLDYPWRRLSRFVELEVTFSRIGMLYLARGHVRSNAPELAGALRDQHAAHRASGGQAG